MLLGKDTIGSWVPVTEESRKICCQNCGKDSGFTHDSIMFYVIPTQGIICGCGTVIVHSNSVMMY